MMYPLTHLSSALASIYTSLFLFSLLTDATPAEIERRGNVPSVPDQNHGAGCDASTGELHYQDCLKTIWTMPADRDQSSYKGQRILFPPAGLECAVAIFPFPVPFGGRVDYTSWLRLQNGASKIGSACQRDKRPGTGGFDYGFGVNGNTGIMVFKMPRPTSAGPNFLAYLPAHSWDVVHHYMYALAYPDSVAAEVDDIGGSSSGPGTSVHFAEIMAQITPEWYDPEAPPPNVNSETNSISSLVNQQQPANELATFPGGSAAMAAFELEHPGQGSSGACGPGYCHNGADCNGCGQCFNMAHQGAISILFGIAQFFASIGRCLKGVEGGTQDSGSGSGKRMAR